MLLRKFYFCSDQVKNKLISAYFVFAMGLLSVYCYDCVRRDLRKAEEEEKWREKANNWDQWKQITKVAILRSDQ